MNEAPGLIDELAGNIRNLKEKIWINTRPVTNSGNPTTDNEETLIILSEALFSFKPAITPKKTANGTEIIIVINASIRELRSLPKTKGLISDFVLKD